MKKIVKFEFSIYVCYTMLLNTAYLCDRGLDPVVYAALYLGSDAEHRLLQEDFVQQSIQRFVSVALKPNSITLAGSNLVVDRFETCRRPASNQLRTSFEPASAMEFGREPASSC